MKKSTFVMLVLLASTMSLSLIVADEYDEVLNPMLFIELNADIKSDWALAEKLLIIDIKDELLKQQPERINHEFLIAKTMKFSENDAIQFSALKLAKNTE